MRALIFAGLTIGSPAYAATDPAPDPLMVEVEPFPSWPRRGALPRPEAKDLPIAKAGRANIDGTLNEPAWASEPGPPLIPLDSAQHAPEARIVALSTPDGMAFGLSGQPTEASWSTTITVDPTGTRSHWLQVDLRDGRATWKRCAPDPIISEGPGTPPWPTAAMPCEQPELTASKAVRGPDGWEILVAWEDLPAPALSTIQIGWFARGPEGQGGTWHRGRGATAIPPTGRVQAMSDRPIGRLRYDMENGGAKLQVTARNKEQTGTWTWTTLVSGVEAARGTIEVPSTNDAGGTGEIMLTDLPYEGAVMVAQDLQVPLTPAAVVFLPRRYFQANPLNPIHEGTVTVAVHLLDVYPEAPVVVRDRNGQVLGQATVSLPAGRSDLRIAIPRDWPDATTLEVGTLLDPDTRLLRRGATQRRVGER